MNNSVLIAIIICLTVIILFILACIHDLIIKSADRRAIKKFDQAFKTFREQNAANEAYKADPAPVRPDDIKFPNSEIETRPRRYR